MKRQCPICGTNRHFKDDCLYCFRCDEYEPLHEVVKPVYAHGENMSKDAVEQRKYRKKRRIISASSYV